MHKQDLFPFPLYQFLQWKGETLQWKVHDKTPQSTSISSTRSQPSIKVCCLTYGRQFTNRRLACHQHSYQVSNSINTNLYDHSNSIPSLTPTLPISTWTWVLSLNVLRSFHLNFCCLRLYHHILTILHYDVQVAFHFPLDKLAHDPYDVATWHLLLLLAQWCFVLPSHGKAIRHKETQS